MNESILFEPYMLGEIKLENRIVMAPMIRSRAIGNVPNELMAKYYSQRTSAGLQITEGTSPSPNGLGYARMPGCFSKEQVEGWMTVTSAVHAGGGKIFMQLMHTGRISHSLNLPEGAQIISASSLQPKGQIWTDAKQFQDFPIPKQMDDEDILLTLTEYAASAKHAMDAGFDGIELDGTHGCLLEQFMSPLSNIRTDKYGGNIENRCRFVLELVNLVANTIGPERTGIRLSPYDVKTVGEFYPEIDETYTYLAKEFNNMGIAYIHLVDHSSMGTLKLPFEIKIIMRKYFKNTMILSGGYDKERAEMDIEGGMANLIAFGRPFINNPDLVERLKNNLPFSTNLKTDLYYTADEKGYTDYPVYNSHEKVDIDDV